MDFLSSPLDALDDNEYNFLSGVLIFFFLIVPLLFIKMSMGYAHDSFLTSIHPSNCFSSLFNCIKQTHFTLLLSVVKRAPLYELPLVWWCNCWVQLLELLLSKTLRILF